MSRAIKIFGIGFSDTDSDAEVEIKIDDDVIYSGTVTTDKDTKLSAYLSGSELDQTEVASWIEDDPASTKSLSIKAVSGNFLYTETLTTLSGEENSDDVVLFAVHNHLESDGDEVADPNSNIYIDGEVYEDGAPENRDDLFGQWDIGIPEGSTLTCDLTIDEAPKDPEGKQVEILAENLTSTSFEVVLRNRETSYEYVSGGTVTTSDDSVLNIANFEYDNSTGNTIITTSENHGLSAGDEVTISDVTLSFTEDGETKEIVAFSS